MNQWRNADEKLMMSERLEALGRTVRARLKGFDAEENTKTGPPANGEEPFLDVFEEMPDAPYAHCLAHAIVRSWLTAPVVVYDEDILLGVPRPEMIVHEHFSWGLWYNRHLFGKEPFLSREAQTRARVEAMRKRLFPLDWNYMGEEGFRRFGRETFLKLEDGLWTVGGYQGHTVPGYPKLLRLGLGGAAEEIRSYMANTQDEEKLVLYEALIIILEGIRDYAYLYADAAERRAKETGSMQLMRAAENLRSIAWAKPETLYQAAQLMWLYSLWDWVDCVGRFDQYMEPFFSKAMAEGGVFPAEDIIGALYLKFQEHGVHNLGLGGVKPEDWTDATNDLTFLVLQTGRAFFGVHPRIQVRIHRNSPPELMRLIVKMWSEGMSDPTLVSDELVIPGLMKYGVTCEDARDYTTLGCQEIEIPGRSNFGCEDGTINLAKIFEYTINDGRDRLTGDQVGLHTGYLTDYDSVEDLWEAYERQMKYLTKHMIELCNLGAQIRSANLAKLVKMAFTDDCVARGLNPDGGGAKYNYGVIETAGSSAVADSFAAIDQLVFREKKLTMAQLQAAIDADFAGYERERQLLLRRAPKFGNDDALADGYACRVLESFWGELGRYRSVRGGAFMGACSLLTRGIYLGRNTWAMPDGRKAGEELGNTIGARTGADRSGVTALLRSVMKLPLDKGVGGVTLNVLLPKNMLETGEMQEKAASMMTAYMLGGGQMAQVTTARLEEMLDAQVHPERHGDLIIRVGGYSARFIEVDEATQREIIRRYGA